MQTNIAEAWDASGTPGEHVGDMAIRMPDFCSQVSAILSSFFKSGSARPTRAMKIRCAFLRFQHTTLLASVNRAKALCRPEPRADRAKALCHPEPRTDRAKALCYPGPVPPEHCATLGTVPPWACAHLGAIAGA